MNDKPDQEFKISLDDGLLEQDDVRKPTPKTSEAIIMNRGQQPDRNITWIPYVLIVILVGAMIAGYFDIRNRLMSVHSSGSMETQHLSEDLQSKFTNLSNKFSDLEVSLKNLTEGQNKLTESLTSVKSELEKVGKSVSSLKSTKADKKELSASVNNVENEVAALTESVKKNTADTAVMSAKLKVTLTEMEASSAQVSEKLNALKAVLDAIQTDKASKKDLLTEIDHVENVLKANRAQNDKQTGGMLQSIRQMEGRIGALEVKAGISSPTGKQSAAPVSSGASSEKASAPPSPSAPGPGGLIERDIAQ